MKGKILVLAPYDENLLKTLNDVLAIEDVFYGLIGNKKTIVEKCFKLKIDSRKFAFYDVEDEIEICLFCKELMQRENISYVIFGDISKYNQKKILDVQNHESPNMISIIDFPAFKHFLFISDSTSNFNTDFEDKKRAILSANDFMNLLNIKQVNVVLVSNHNQKTDMLESNIIKMIIKDSDLKNIEIINFCNLRDLFNKENNINIYRRNINLLIMKNYEVSKMFIDTLNIFGAAKTAFFMTYNDITAVDMAEAGNYENMVFSLIILNKLYKYANLKQKHLIQRYVR